MADDLFLRLYKGLNARQKKAVDTIEGPVMVIAGPGTGKTTVLTLRIAQILRTTDTPPDGILALTFTESAVASMRRKLVQLIGPAAYRVGLYTFHGFAQEVIGRYSESFPRIIGGDVATEAEKLSIIEKIIDENEFEFIKPFGAPYFYVKSILHTISDLKRDALTPKDFIKVLDKEEKDILAHEDVYHEKGKYKGEMKSAYKTVLRSNKKNRELVAVYKMYEEALALENLYDFDDMLLELLRAFKREPDLLQTLQEEHLYFLADEHQDANNAQNGILEKLAGYFEEPNLFIVGDEKQAIYRFQGASLENFLYFKSKFPTAKLIYLDENYRSTQEILDISHALAEVLPGDKALRPRLLAKSEREPGSVRIVSFKTERDEREGIIDEVERLIKDGTNPEEIAILTRTNRETTELGRSLMERGVPTNLFQDEDVLEDKDVAKLMLLLSAVANPTDEHLLGEVLFINFLKIDPIESTRMLRRAYFERASLLDVVKESDPAFAQKFSGFVTLVRNEGALDSFTAIVSESGLTEHLLTLPESIQKMALLSALYQEIASRQAHKKTLTLRDFLLDIETLREHGGRLSWSARLPREKSVSIMTAHKSKGLEWQTIIIPHAVDGVWGNKRSQLSFRLPFPLGSAHQSGQEEDERRLFYVALTRARERIVITHSHIRGDGREQVLSRFVEELPKDLVVREEGQSTDVSEDVLRKVERHLTRERTVWDKDYLRDIFFEQGLGATSLNNYIECPWKYFFENLLCVPHTQGRSEMFGLAVHDALSQLTNSLRLGREMSEGDFFKAFEKRLQRQPFTDQEFKEAMKKGKKVVEAFWKEKVPTWHKNSFAEFKISGVFVPLGEMERVTIKGRLDKLEIHGEREVRVVDYKTGSPKTRNELMGKTANATGAEKRQLDFYRLLLELYDNGKYEMTRGAILFTEPDEKGRIQEEEFGMSHEDAENIEREIIRVTDEIRNFTFWGNKCHDPECEYCKLRDVLIVD
ncbi:ATP-dependent helicase [Candidatus Parcubacteria bacterium]|nr:ATP-dependent helicase [Candidatus Parcubacteria bacterium]